MNATEAPIPALRFQVDFTRATLGEAATGGELPLGRGAFAECTGLEATMETKVIKSGGANYGAAQRVGPVTFGTVVLKRGLTTSRHLWEWFAYVTLHGWSAYRLNVTIAVFEPVERTGPPVARFHLLRALPVKLKCADLNARVTEVAIEELHLAHEGLTLD